MTAKTLNEGRSMEGAHAGFPFPIPKTGNEAMWNHLVRFNGQAYEAKYRNLNVDASGRTNLATEGLSNQEYPFWDNTKTSAETFWRIKLTYTGPARRAGEALMLIDPLDIGTKDRRAWSYLPGQRRTKVAPDLSHDTPNPGTAGATTFDDTFIFNGSMERFDFKLVGKKEMLVPYNAYAAVYQAKQDDLLKPNHLNPDLVRWELHRVWIVEATLKEGKRHVYSKRTFYLDEDSWAAVASDEYDARGQLYRTGFAYMAPSYDLPAPYTDMFGHYDLVARALLADRLHRRDRRPEAHQAARASASGPPTPWPAPACADPDAAREIPMQRRTLLKALAAGGVLPLAAGAAAPAASHALARRARHAGAEEPAGRPRPAHRAGPRRQARWSPSASAATCC